MGLVALQNVGVTMIPVVTQSLRDSLVLSDARIGLLTSMLALAAGVVALPTGLATAVWGGRVVIVGAVLFMLGSLVFAAGDSYAWLLAGRFIQGLGAGVAMPAAAALINRFVVVAARPAAFGIFGLGTGLGTIVTLLIMPAVTHAWGYQGVFLVAAAFGACLALAGAATPAIRMRPPGDHRGPGGATIVRAVGRAALSPGILLVSLVSAAATAMVVGAFTWTPQFLHHSFGSTMAVAAYITAGIGVALMAGNPAGAVATRRWGAGATMAVSLACMAAAAALAPVAVGIALAVTAVLIAVFLAGVVLPPSLSAIGEVTRGPESLGAATGFIGLVTAVGAIVAPWAFGALLDAYGTAPEQSGYTAGFIMLAALGAAAAIGALVFTLLRRSGRLQPRDLTGPAAAGGRSHATSPEATPDPPAASDD